MPANVLTGLATSFRVGRSAGVPELMATARGITGVALLIKEPVSVVGGVWLGEWSSSRLELLRDDSCLLAGGRSSRGSGLSRCFLLSLNVLLAGDIFSMAVPPLPPITPLTSTLPSELLSLRDVSPPPSTSPRP